MYIKFCAKTNVGKVRSDNQDSYAAVVEPRKGLFLLADGMGGAKGGKIASSIAVHKIFRGLLPLVEGEKPVSKNQVKKVFTETNDLILAAGRAKEEYEGMGTTLVLFWISDSAVLLAHVGDSRAYSFDGNRLVQLTKDHTLIQELIDSGEIQPEAADKHPVSHLLTKALGQEETYYPDFSKVSLGLEPGLKILLCSDGLHGQVSEDRIKELLEKDAKEAARALIEEANNNGGKDNVTVIVVELTQEPEKKEFFRDTHFSSELGKRYLDEIESKSKNVSERNKIKEEVGEEEEESQEKKKEDPNQHKPVKKKAVFVKGKPGKEISERRVEEKKEKPVEKKKAAPVKETSEQEISEERAEKKNEKPIRKKKTVFVKETSEQEISEERAEKNKEKTAKKKKVVSVEEMPEEVSEGRVENEKDEVSLDEEFEETSEEYSDFEGETEKIEVGEFPEGMGHVAVLSWIVQLAPIVIIVVFLAFLISVNLGVDFEEKKVSELAREEILEEKQEKQTFEKVKKGIEEEDSEPPLETFQKVKSPSIVPSRVGVDLVSRHLYDAVVFRDLGNGANWDRLWPTEVPGEKLYATFEQVELKSLISTQLVQLDFELNLIEQVQHDDFNFSRISSLVKERKTSLNQLKSMAEEKSSVFYNNYLDWRNARNQYSSESDQMIHAQKLADRDEDFRQDFDAFQKKSYDYVSLVEKWNLDTSKEESTQKMIQAGNLLKEQKQELIKALVPGSEELLGEYYRGAVNWFFVKQSVEREIRNMDHYLFLLSSYEGKGDGISAERVAKLEARSANLVSKIKTLSDEIDFKMEVTTLKLALARENKMPLEEIGLGLREKQSGIEEKKELK